MEELRKLEEAQRMLTSIQSRSIATTSSNKDCNCFLSKLTLLLIQPCGELDLENKCSLVLEYMPKISAAILEEESNTPFGKATGYEESYFGKALQLGFDYRSDSVSLETKCDETAVIGLDAMQRANSTLEDFLDNLNEKAQQASSSEMNSLERRSEAEGHGLISQFSNVFKSDPFKPLERLLECHDLLTKRVQEEFKYGEEYWALERKLCYALTNKMQISVEDAIKAIHLKSFDYRVLNLLLYQLRGEQINELHMEFLSVSEFLVEVADDLFDYEEDVWENNFNILRMFVRIYGDSAPTVLAKYITEAEEKYNQVLKALDPQLSLNYQRRCVEATKEGGNMSGHPLGTWSIPPLIRDEEFYRSSQQFKQV